MFDAISTPPDETGPRSRMARLQRLSEFGLSMAERLDRQSELAAIYSDTCAVPEHLHPPYARRLDEIARAFAQLSRAVTLAIALEERIEADLKAGPAAAHDRALKRDLLAQRIEAGRPDTPDPTLPAAATPAETPDADRAPDTRPRLDRLLNADLAELDALLRRPPEEIIAGIRRDLGLAPDAEAPNERGLPARESNVEDAGWKPALPEAPAARRDLGQALDSDAPPPLGARASGPRRRRRGPEAHALPEPAPLLSHPTRGADPAARRRRWLASAAPPSEAGP